MKKKNKINTDMDAENNVVDDNMNKEDQQRLDNDNEAQPVELNDEHPNVDNSNQLNTNHRRLVLDNEGKELDDEQESQKTEDIVEDADEVTQPMDDEDEEDDDEEVMDDDGKLDLTRIFNILKKKWWMIALNCLIIGVIAALLIVEEPRTYTSSVILAPEAEYGAGGGGLSSLASSFGIDIGNVSSSDAIRPDLYPNLVASTDFILDLFKLPVRSLDGNIYTDYYTYLKKYQRSSWWKKDLKKFMSQFRDKPKNPKALAGGNDSGLNGSKSQIHVLSPDEESMVEGIRSAINCSVDKQTFTITIQVTDQDPLISSTVADSVRSKIQAFVTDYRTKKATKDFNYYYKLLLQAKGEYEKALKAYTYYVDTHRDIILQSYISERDQLENNMQLKLNTYNAMLTQVQNAKNKIQENTPAFTVLQNAVVPVKPSGPKRMLFVLGFVFMTFLFTSVMIVLRS
jgi:hypothetical protein